MKHGGHIVAEALQSQGVQQIFTLCGGHISPILSGCKAAGIEVWDARHEASAVFAADAVSRLTGIPGVAAVTAGPGVTNAITAVKNAQMAQSPLILLGGASATVLRGRGSLQDINQLELIQPHVKKAWTIAHVRDIRPTLEAAFRESRSGIPGPVFVELPLDVLYPESLVREWYGIKGSERGQGLAQKAIQQYLNLHAQNLFREESPWPDTRKWLSLARKPAELASAGLTTLESEAAARQASRWLRKARKPLLLLSSQCVSDPAAIPALVQAIETLGIPCYLSGMARGLLSRDHPLQCRHQRKQALREADCVVLAGVPCDFRLDYGSHIRSRAKLIAVNRSLHDLFLNRLPSLPVLGDPAEFLQILARQTGQQAAASEDWTHVLQNREEDRERDIREQASLKGEHINPIDLLRQVDTQLTQNSVIVADGGDFVATAAYTLQPHGPLRWLDPGVFGTLGVGGGFALGAAAARPDADIWIIYGDGSSAYSLAEFDTFARHGRGVIAIIGNDGCWNQIARDQVEILEDDVAVMLRQSDYQEVARGYGGEGFRLDKREDIPAVLKQARELAAAGKPVVINAILDKSDFRKGSISV